MGSMSVFVMQMLYVCVLCASCDSYQCCILHDLQFVNAGRGHKRRHMEDAYSRASLMTALYVAMSVSFCLPHPVAVSVFFPFVVACAFVLRCCECMCCV